jgi:hypothetical protein
VNVNLKRTGIIFGLALIFILTITSSSAFAQKAKKEKDPLKGGKNLREAVRVLQNTTSDLQNQINTIELTPGPQGPIGPQGSQGIAGAAGPQGPAGANGAQGPQGEQGAQGVAGPAGADGSQGPQGEQGLQGLAGADGADGADGAQGPQGEQGLQGVAGPIGSIGPAGPKGDQGDIGPAGPSGGDDSADGVEITFGKLDSDSGQNYLDINGTNLVSDPSIDPTVSIGKTSVNVLATTDLGNEMFQVITDIPAGTVEGNHRVTLSNTLGNSSMGMWLPLGPALHSGANWIEATTSAGWSARYGHQSLVYDEKLWIMGGLSTDANGGPKNDVWSSSDGIT